MAIASPFLNEAKTPVVKTSSAFTGQFVNLGCGSRHHPQWLNIDQWVPDSSIQGHDLGKGVPLADESVDVLYHSHVLEHFDRVAAAAFLDECFRVLKPNGVIRVVVPDLEKMARLYLQALEESLCGSEQWKRNYDWLLLEMYDQAVREKPGGGITDYFRSGVIPNRDFILERMGAVPVERLLEALRGESAERAPVAFRREKRKRWKAPSVARVKELALRLILSKRDYACLKAGRFRHSGEVHKWMYDRYSLGAMLERAGFRHVCQRSAFESAIPGWREFHLDTEPDGSIYKPDSLYMEAVKSPGDTSLALE